MKEQKLYAKKWFCILTLIFFAPVGIFLLWKYKHFSPRVSKILAVASVVFFIYALITAPSNEFNTDDDTVKTASENKKITEAPSETVLNTDAPTETDVATEVPDQKTTEDPAKNSQNLQEHHSFLLDYGINKRKVLNGTGDAVIGERAYVNITDNELKKITSDDLKEFADKVIDRSDYSYVSIIAPSGKGICFAGNTSTIATYGKLAKDGSVKKTIGYWSLDKNNNYTYSKSDN